MRTTPTKRDTVINVESEGTRMRVQYRGTIRANLNVSWIKQTARAWWGSIRLLETSERRGLNVQVILGVPLKISKVTLCHFSIKSRSPGWKGQSETYVSRTPGYYSTVPPNPSHLRVCSGLFPRDNKSFHSLNCASSVHVMFSMTLWKLQN